MSRKKQFIILNTIAAFLAVVALFLGRNYFDALLPFGVVVIVLAIALDVFVRIKYGKQKRKSSAKVMKIWWLIIGLLPVLFIAGLFFKEKFLVFTALANWLVFAIAPWLARDDRILFVSTAAGWTAFVVALQRLLIL